MKKHHYLGAILLIMTILTACTNSTEQNSNQDVGQSDIQQTATYECITQEEAHALMEDGNDCIILDVRTQEEYDEKHILNAICIPNETIGTEPPAELPDKDQLILVYCRSGNRSKQASEKLAAMGYTNIKEFGGINTWTGATVSHKE